MSDQQFTLAMAEIRRLSNQLFFVIALSILVTTLICTAIASKFYEKGASITIEATEIRDGLPSHSGETQQTGSGYGGTF